MLTKPQADSVLRPHYITLKKALDGGWHAWHQHYKDRHPILDARARAAIVYCEITALAKQFFDGCPDVKIVRKGAMHLFYIGDDVLLRFKKLRNGKPSNIKTRQQVLLQQQQSIPGILPGTLVSAGYQLDQLEQAIEKTLVVAQLDGRSIWSLDLNIGEADGRIAVMPSAQKQHKASRVAARQVKKRKESEKED
jgi:hypothetical protein